MKKLLIILLFLCSTASFGQNFIRGCSNASAAPTLGLVGAWYESDRTTHSFLATSTTGTVAKWLDTTGHGHTLAAGTVAASPRKYTRGVAFWDIPGIGSDNMLFGGTDIIRPSKYSVVLNAWIDWVDHTQPYAASTEAIWFGGGNVTMYGSGTTLTTSGQPLSANGSNGNYGSAKTPLTVVCVWDDANSRIYVNGVLKATGNSIVQPGTGFVFGGWFGYYPIAGAATGLLFYNRALSDAECRESRSWF